MQAIAKDGGGGWGGTRQRRRQKKGSVKHHRDNEAKPQRRTKQPRRDTLRKNDRSGVKGRDEKRGQKCVG